jgi:hypothetical protein
MTESEKQQLQQQEQAKLEEYIGFIQLVASKNLLVANYILHEAVSKYQNAATHPEIWNKLHQEDPVKMDKLLESMNKETKKFMNKIKRLGEQAGVIIELEAGLKTLAKA